MVSKSKYLLLAAALAYTALLQSRLQAEESPTKTHEQVIREVEQAVEQAGVKVGMNKEKVMQLLGDKYTEVKISQLAANEKVLIWQKDKSKSVTVTFVDDKVKAVAHSMNKPEEED